MDNEINPLAKHSQHFSKYAMFYRGIIFEDARSRERQKPAEKGFLPTTARVHPFGSVTDAHDKRTIWGISMTFFSSLAWTGISFLLFTVLVAVISAWKTRDEQLDTAEGYFLAGRGPAGRSHRRFSAADQPFR